MIWLHPCYKRGGIRYKATYTGNRKTELHNKLKAVVKSRIEHTIVSEMSGAVPTFSNTSTKVGNFFQKCNRLHIFFLKISFP